MYLNIRRLILDCRSIYTVIFGLNESAAVRNAVHFPSPLLLRNTQAKKEGVAAKLTPRRKKCNGIKELTKSFG